MINPSNFDEIVLSMQKQIKTRLNSAAQSIIEEEVQKVLGRVKIITHKSLNDTMEVGWFINPENKENET